MCSTPASSAACRSAASRTCAMRSRSGCCWLCCALTTAASSTKTQRGTAKAHFNEAFMLLWCLEPGPAPGAYVACAAMVRRSAAGVAVLQTRGVKLSAWGRSARRWARQGANMLTSASCAKLSMICGASVRAAVGMIMRLRALPGPPQQRRMLRVKQSARGPMASTAP